MLWSPHSRRPYRTCRLRKMLIPSGLGELVADGVMSFRACSVVCQGPTEGAPVLSLPGVVVDSKGQSVVAVRCLSHGEVCSEGR